MKKVSLYTERNAMVVLVTLAALSFTLIFFASLATAGTFERIVMPGPVIEGHAKYENECSRCHRLFSKAAQKGLCLECHKKVSADVKEKKGFHGLRPEVKGVKCRHCHTDHKGRGADVVGIDTELFDHSKTDFVLKGAHARTKCTECHKPKKKYRAAESKCVKCHKEDDVHKERLGAKCADCHSEKTWKKPRFEHDKTKFKLKGEHKKTACNRCHPNNRYKKTPKVCASCHLISDVHRGSYGKKCAECHTPKEWKRTSFDHDKTKFKLKGAHAKVECAKCHEGRLYTKETPRPKDKALPKSCIGCHKSDDEHRGRYGKKCAECHNPKEWKRTKFDHAKTEFKLKGAHTKVDCIRCHKGAIEEKKKSKKNLLPKTCIGCHRNDDVHNDQDDKRCEKCHNNKSWTKNVSFEHDITRFPLIGLHAVAPCEACHTSVSFRETKRECESCHKEEDVHKRGLGPECGACHNPNGWRLWNFDHDTRTDFELDGAHLGLNCRACHWRKARHKVRASGSCISCHREDDIHRGGFGFQCQRCHTNETFDEIKMTD